MQKMTRRAALKGGAAVAALGAPLAVMPLNAEAADADAHLEVLHAEYKGAGWAYLDADQRTTDARMALRKARPVVSVPMPDGSTRTCSNEAAIDEAINVWWRDHPEMKARAWPKLEAEAFARLMAAETPEAERGLKLELDRLFNARIAPVRREIEGRKTAALERLDRGQNQQAVARLESHYERCQEASNQAEERETAAFDRLVTTPADTARGMLVKLRPWIEFNSAWTNEPPIDKQPLREVSWEAAPVVSIIYDLKRLAGED